MWLSFVLRTIKKIGDFACPLTLYRLLYIHYSHMKVLLNSILWEWLCISWYFIAFQSAWQTFEVHHNVWQATNSMDNLFGININSNVFQLPSAIFETILACVNRT